MQPTAMPVAPFWKRLTLMPFVPRMWAEARAWPVSAVLLPLLCLSLLLSASLGLYRGVEFRGLYMENAQQYDASFDPIVVEHGVVRVEGTRLPRHDNGRLAYLVDPDETVPLSEIRAPRYFIVRRDTVTRFEHGATRDVSIPELADALGIEHLRIDGRSLRELDEKYGIWAIAALTAMIVVFFVGADALLCPAFALLAGLAAATLAGRRRGLDLRATFRMALATLALRPVVGTALALAGTNIDGCVGLIAWPAIAAVLTTAAMRTVPPPAPEPHPPAAD